MTTGVSEMKDGVSENVPMGSYLAIPNPSSSTVKAIGHRTLKAVKMDIDRELWPDDDTGAKHLGSAAHAAILEPDVFASDYVVLPTADPNMYLTAKGEPSKNPRATAAYKADVFALKEANEGKSFLEADDHVAAIQMQSQVHAHADASAVLHAGGLVEGTVIVTDKETGIQFKLRPDFYSEKLAWNVNVKTTKNAIEAAFKRDFFNFEYHVSEAFYARMLPQAGLPVRQSVILAVENTGAHEVCLFEPDEAFMDMGDQVVAMHLRTLARAMDKDEWPGLPSGLVQLSPDEWMFARADALLAQEVVDVY